MTTSSQGGSRVGKPAQPQTPVFNCPSWCVQDAVDRDMCDPSGGMVRHNSRHHIVLACDGTLDHLGERVDVYVETATRLFSGETVEDFAIPGAPMFVALDISGDACLTAAQARDLAAALAAAADLVEAQA